MSPWRMTRWERGERQPGTDTASDPGGPVPGADEPERRHEALVSVRLGPSAPGSHLVEYLRHEPCAVAAWWIAADVDAPIIFAVPVRDLPGRLVRTVRTGRSPQGQRVGIAFTRPELLVAAMGGDQHWEELCESALRGMLRPLGIEVIQVDPLLVAPPLDRVDPAPASGQARTKRTASATTWPSVSSVRISTLPSLPAVN